MDQPHLSSHFDELEQRYQASQEIIAKLQLRIEAQEYQLQEQTLRLEDLQKELAETQSQLTRVVQLDEQFNRLRGELLHLVERSYSSHQEETIIPTSTLAAQLETHTKMLNNLLKEVNKTQRYEEQISLARTEMERVNKSVSTFQTQIDELKKQLDERTRAITYFEDQRRVDTRQIAELQVELPELAKKIEANLSKIKLVEQQIPQFGKYDIALEELRNEIRRSREQTDFQIAERERQMKKWADLAQSQESRIEEYKGLMERYAEHYQLNKRALASLQDFQERLQREQHQAQELQRLAEERIWGSIEKWQNEYDQRWKKQGIEWQPKIADLQKSIEQVQQQIAQFNKFNQTIEQQLTIIFQIIEEDIQARTLAASDWQERFEQLANGQA